MAVLTLSETVRNARLQALLDAIDMGAGDSVISFYTAPQPVGGGAVTSQTLLASCALFTPSGSVANGIMTFNAISDEMAVKSNGVAEWCRIFDGDGNFILDMDCGLSGSGAIMILDDINLNAGGKVSVIGGQIVEGNA